MSQTLLKNAYILTMDAARTVHERGDVLVDGETISQVDAVDPAFVDAGAEVVDCAGRIVMPGLVNTHVHTSQQLARGIADDVDLLTFLRQRVYPFESSMTESEQHLSALACCTEMIRSGVTAFTENGAHHVDGVGRAVEEIGMRCALSRCTMDDGQGRPPAWAETTDEALGRQEDAFRRWDGRGDGRIRYWFSVRTLFNASEGLLTRSKEAADRLGTGLQMHVAEIPEEIEFARARSGGLGTVGYLDKLGILDANLLAVHSVWLTHREIDLLRLHDVKVSHNVGSNMRVLGFADIPEMLRKGITVSIGTDGAACNNRMDLFDEMYTAALIHKGRWLDPTVVPAHSILEMATVNGARSLLQDDMLGSLEPGKQADLIVVDPRTIGALPVHDPVPSLVYAMHSTNVSSTMCAGRWLMRDRQMLTIDEEALLDEVQDAADLIRRRAGIDLPDRWPVERLERV